MIVSQEPKMVWGFKPCVDVTQRVGFLYDPKHPNINYYKMHFRFSSAKLEHERPLQDAAHARWRQNPRHDFIFFAWILSSTGDGIQHVFTLLVVEMVKGIIKPPQMQLQLHCVNYTTPQLQLHYTTTTTKAALHHTTSSSFGWGDRPDGHCSHCNHSKKHNSNHLSVHQWIRPAIRDSQQSTSPKGFLFLKFPPPPCAVLLVCSQWFVIFDHPISNDAWWGVILFCQPLNIAVGMRRRSGRRSKNWHGTRGWPRALHRRWKWPPSLATKTSQPIGSYIGFVQKDHMIEPTLLFFGNHHSKFGRFQTKQEIYEQVHIPSKVHKWWIHQIRTHWLKGTRTNCQWEVHWVPTKD